MKLYLYYNENNSHFADVAAKLKARLDLCGIESDFSGNADDYTAVCAIGGDGTILDASEIALKRDLPIFGVNAGRIGFLAAFDECEVDEITAEKLSALYESKRDVLVANIDSTEQCFTAINDVVFSKQNPAQSIELNLGYNDKELGGYRCDGIIVATPTGSTAYSMSAGGPVVVPDVPGIVITPVCPGNKPHRSVVVPSTSTVSVSMAKRQDNEAIVIADGKQIAAIGREQKVTIKRYNKQLKLLLSPTRKVYEILTGTAGGNR